MRSYNDRNALFKTDIAKESSLLLKKEGLDSTVIAKMNITSRLDDAD
jgi:hypothetical protein